jgi:PhzF family phenazine biosynthesis protein
VGVPLFQVDAFADEPFAGNPAAVCLLEGPAPEDWMRSVAAEMNLSETAFAHRIAGDRYGLRWFTPTVEVDLCGHATLATAHVLFGTGRAETAVLAFETRSGVLPTTRRGELIELDFPTQYVAPAEPEPALLAALGGVTVAATHAGGGRWLLELDDEAAVRRVGPDFTGLVPYGIVCITSRADDAALDFVSRVFGPAHGIDEDPVTGSTHCVLSAYWAERLGRTELVGYQASSRGGVVHVRLAGDRTLLAGHAVTVLEGALTPPP